MALFKAVNWNRSLSNSRINDALADVLTGADCAAKLNLAHFKAQQSTFDIFSNPFTATVVVCRWTLKQLPVLQIQQSESKVSSCFNAHASLLAPTSDSFCLRLIRFFVFFPLRISVITDCIKVMKTSSMFYKMPRDTTSSWFGIKQSNKWQDFTNNTSNELHCSLNLWSIKLWCLQRYKSCYLLTFWPGYLVYWFCCQSLCWQGNLVNDQ